MRSQALVVLGLVAVLGGCKAASTTVTTSDFCARWVTAWCAKNAECCGDPAGTYRTLADCQAAQSAGCSVGIGVAFAPVGGLPAAATFNPSSAGSALAAIQAPGCPVVAPSLDSADPPIVTGTRRTGEDCSPVGGDLSPTLTCAIGYRCLLGATRSGALHGQCVPEGLEGSTCASQTCRGDLYCDLAPGATTGSCQPRAMATTCHADSDCLGTCANIDPTTHVGMCTLFSSASPFCVAGAAIVTTPPPADGGTPD